jgi:pyrroline-5-carboxylate reductase
MWLCDTQQQLQQQRFPSASCAEQQVAPRAAARLVEAAGPEARVVRVMPNTPCLVGETAAAMCLGGKVRRPLGLERP